MSRNFMSRIFSVPVSLTDLLLLLLLDPFNGLFSSITGVSRYQKSTTSLDLNEERGHEILGYLQWHQLDYMQTICTSLQADNDINNSIFTGGMFFLTPKPNQQCQNTEGKSDLLTCYMPMVSRRELLLQRKNCSGVKQNSSYQLTKIVISESVHRPTSSTATSEKTKEPNQ